MKKGILYQILEGFSKSLDLNEDTMGFLDTYLDWTISSQKVAKKEKKESIHKIT